MYDDVQEYAPNGTFLLSFGGKGVDRAQPGSQSSMTIDADDYVWDANPAHQIDIWDHNGLFLTSWTGTGANFGPSAIAVDGNGRSYVTDGNRHLVYLLDRFGDPVAWWVGSGTADGQFTAPTAIALDGKGGIYVADNLGPVTRVQIFRLLPPLAPPSYVDSFPAAVAAGQTVEAMRRPGAIPGASSHSCKLRDATALIHYQQS